MPSEGGSAGFGGRLRSTPPAATFPAGDPLGLKFMDKKLLAQMLLRAPLSTTTTGGYVNIAGWSPAQLAYQRLEAFSLGGSLKSHMDTLRLRGVGSQ